MCVTTRHLGLELYNLQVNIYSHSCIDWNKDLDVLLEIRVVYLQMYVYIYIYVYNDIISFALHFVHFVHLLLSFKEWPSSVFDSILTLPQLPQSETPRQGTRSATVTPGNKVQWSKTLAALQSLMSAKRRLGPDFFAVVIMTFVLKLKVWKNIKSLKIKRATTTFYMLL